MARQSELFEIETIKKEMSKGPCFYTVKDAADILKVNYITLWRLITFGEIDGSKIGGTWRIPANALIDYLERRHPFNMEDR
ncbi:MAG: helix-turn-helix domain-containing protein [Nitrospinae bacterium]|nr:helix-turn-helix domain-containing protein [Nitrospinota bacterium]